MKFLLQIAAVLIIVAGLFFLLGYLVSEQRNINEVQVKAPIELCWDICQDESRLSEWMEGVSGIQLVAGAAGQVGSKQKVIMSSVENSTSELQRTITKVSKPTVFSYDYTNDMMTGRSEITFLARDSITTIKSTDIFSGKKLWLRSTLYLMKSSINRKTQAQYEKLKDIIENDYKVQLRNEANATNENLEMGIEID